MITARHRQAHARAVVALFTAACLLALAGCAGGSTPDKAADKYGLLSPGVITAATQSDQVPFAFTGSDGKLQGFSIELANEVARRLSLKIDYRVTNLQGILTGLTANKYDIGVAGLAATDERKQSVDFITPYYWGFIGIMTLASSSTTAIKDLDGKKVAVVSGSSQEAYASESLTNARVTAFKDQPAAVNQLLSGGVDAFVVGGSSAVELVDHDPKMKIAIEADSPQGSSFPFPKNHPALVNGFETTVNAIIEDGTYLKIYRKWFKRPMTPALLKVHPELVAQVKGTPLNPAAAS